MQSYCEEGAKHGQKWLQILLSQTKRVNIQERFSLTAKLCKKHQKNTIKGNCGSVMFNLIQTANFFTKNKPYGSGKGSKKFNLEENCESLLNGCTAKRSQIGYGVKLAIPLGKSICFRKHYKNWTVKFLQNFQIKTQRNT